MKVVVYGPMNRLGFVVDGKVVDGQEVTAMYLQKEGERSPMEMANVVVGSDLHTFLNGGDRALSTAKKALAYYKDSGMRGVTMAWNLKDVKLKPPLANTSATKVMMVGGNYADHIRGLRTLEQARADALKEVSWGFYKLGCNIIADGDPIQYPGRTKRLDYEAEIAIVYGKRGKDIPASKYLDYVFGVTLMNDMSIRDGGGVWDRNQGSLTFQFGKNFDNSGVLGPWIVTLDEVPDPQNLDFMSKVNGQVRQKGNTRDMIKKFGHYTEVLSTDMVINPGDIFSGGTCAGTAADATPKLANGQRDPNDDHLFVKVGDTVEVSSPQIGSLTNKIVPKSMD